MDPSVSKLFLGFFIFYIFYFHCITSFNLKYTLFSRIRLLNFTYVRCGAYSRGGGGGGGAYLKGSYHKDKKEGGWSCRTGRVYSLPVRIEEREDCEESTE